MLLEHLIPSKRGSIENPAVPLSDVDSDHPYYGMFTGGTASSSGIAVTPSVGLTASAVWRGVSLISRDVAKCPLIVYQRVGEGKERATKHPAYRLLKQKPNGYCNAFTFKQTLVSHALFTGRGNGYAYIVRDGAGRPVELLLLNPATTYPLRRNGELWYVTEIDDAGLRRMRPEDVLHVKGLGYDGLVGYDIVSYMRETLGLDLGMQRFGSVFFKNHAVPGVVLERPREAPPLSAQAERNVRDSFDQIVCGLDNVHRTAILQEGMKATLLGIEPQKAQMAELRQFNIREYANFLGVPPHKLGDTTRTAYASLEQENQSYLDDALDGWMCNLEAECNDKLLSEEEKANDTHLIEFLRESLVRVNFESLVNGLVNEVNNGLLNLDEARSILNKPPLPGGAGQKYRRPANIEEIATEPEQEPEPGENPDQTAAQRAADLEAFKRDVVKAFLSDRTVNDVLFNMTDIRKLVQDVQLPLEPKYVEPWMPVRDDTGEMVSGEVMKDEEGDVVGGDVVEESDQRSAVSGQPEQTEGDQDSEPETGEPSAAEDEEEEKDTEQPNGQTDDDPVASENLTRAHRAILQATIDRMNSRIRTQAVKAARKPDSFVAWIENEMPKNRSVWTDAVAPIAEAMRASGYSTQTVDQLADAYFAMANDGLLEMCECRAEDLRGRLENWDLRFEI